MISIRISFRLNRASWIHCMRASGSVLVCAIFFEIYLPVDMVLGAPVGSLFESSIGMCLGLELGN